MRNFPSGIVGVMSLRRVHESSAVRLAKTDTVEAKAAQGRDASVEGRYVAPRPDGHFGNEVRAAPSKKGSDVSLWREIGEVTPTGN